MEHYGMRCRRAAPESTRSVASPPPMNPDARAFLVPLTGQATSEFFYCRGQGRMVMNGLRFVRRMESLSDNRTTNHFHETTITFSLCADDTGA